MGFYRKDLGEWSQSAEPPQGTGPSPMSKAEPTREADGFTVKMCENFSEREKSTRWDHKERAK